MRHFKFSVLILCSLALIVGCASSYIVKPVKQVDDNKYFGASIEPTMPSMVAGYGAFILTVQNKTDKDIEIDWNKTSFIDEGQANGTFMYSGIIYKDRNNPKSPDPVFAKGTFVKTIYPNNYVVLNQGSGWGHRGFGTGVKGVYLVIKVGDEYLKEQILIDIRK